MGMLMKTQDKQILSILQAYDNKMVLKAYDLYRNGIDNIEKDLIAEGWQEVTYKPENKEFYHINDKYWVQSESVRKQQIKDTVKGLQQKQNRASKPSKIKQNMDLKQVPVLCPQCHGKMYKQNVCGGCSAGKAGYKIRLICENDPDHEILL